MKYLAFLLLLLGGLVSCSKSHVAITEEDIPEEVFILPDELKPYTGECVVYYSGSKNIKEKMTYKKGKLDGQMTSYYTNGNIKRKGEFSNGYMDGVWESWYQDGRKKFTASYERDSLNGEYAEWYRTGVLKEKGLYALNKPIGKWIIYDEAGMLIDNRDSEH